jgi:NAD(P)H-flavin reductase
MNPYLPTLARVVQTLREVNNIRTLRIQPDEHFSFLPGQFVQVSVFGIGEAPFAISSSPLETEHIEITVRRVGNVTSALFRLRKEGVVGIRGPYGNPYPTKDFVRRNAVLIAGGTGITPLRSLLLLILASMRKRVCLLYGAKTPMDFIYKAQLREWRRKGVRLFLTVDRPTPGWRGYVGVVPKLLDRAELPPNPVFAICGPPVMIKFTLKALLDRGAKERRIYFSLERRFQCGLGLCGQCSINWLRVCKDGPVLRYDKVKALPELGF